MKITVCLIISLIFCFVFFTPVYADTLFLQPDGTAGKDANISINAADTNFGDEINLTTNLFNTDHGLIEFDISSIPTGSTINSATLELRENSNCQINQNAIEVHTTQAAWVESTVTWNNAPAYGPSQGTNTGETAGCDWLIFDVAAIIQDWVNGTSVNYGFHITGPSSGDVVKIIYSSDYGVPSERPILNIDYTSPPEPVPTMTEWGMIIFMLLAGLGAVYYIRKKRIES